MDLKSAISSIVTKVGGLWASLFRCVFTIYDAFDRRDLFFFVGLVMIWYGLYSNYSIGLAHIIVGGILAIVDLIGSILGGDK